MNASVKAILLVRDPIVRSVSHWIHSCHNRLNTDAEENKRKCETYEGSGILTEEGQVNVNSLRSFVDQRKYYSVLDTFVCSRVSVTHS